MPVRTTKARGAVAALLAVVVACTAPFVFADVRVASLGAPESGPAVVTALHDRLDLVVSRGPAAVELCVDPYDATACQVDVRVTCGASIVVLPAFFTPGDAAPLAAPRRGAAWLPSTALVQGAAFHARWRPRAKHAGACVVQGVLNGELLPSAALQVTVRTPNGGESGIIGVASNGQYFEDTASGSLFFPTGLNLAWPGGANSTKPFYTATLPPLAAAKGNYVRLWFGPSQVGWSPFSDIQLQRSLGQVDPGAASRVDWLLDECESLGIRALVALESYNSLCTNSKYFCSWDLSVYRDKNGGPLSQASDFWTSAPAYAAFQSYARQVVARWGASPAVFAWQMFNEMDGTLGGVLPVATYWLGNITTYVASIDGHHHLITNSYAGESGLKQDDLLPHISFTTTHAYEGGDLAGTLAHYSAIKSTYGKPTYSGEFGRNASPRLTQLILHNGMWGTIAQLGAASGACWWWQSVFAGPWLDEYTAIATFMEPLPMHKYKWALLNVGGVPSAARVFAQATTDWDMVVGWLQSKDHIFGNNPPYPTVPSFVAQLPGCPSTNGQGWQLTWYNTTTGLAMGSPTTVNCDNGNAAVTTPSFSTDRAFVLSLASV